MDVVDVGRGLACGVVAALLVSLKGANDYREPWVVFTTREWISLSVLHAMIATGLLFLMRELGALAFDWKGLLGFVVGYPLLLRSNLYSIKSADGKDVSVGLEFVTQILEKFILSGLPETLRLKNTDSMRDWVRVGIVAMEQDVKDFLATHPQPPGDGRDKNAYDKWIHELIDDAKTNPANEQANSRLVYNEIEKIGGLRGVRTILKRHRK